jgi:hypothetical protein
MAAGRVAQRGQQRVVGQGRGGGAAGAVEHGLGGRRGLDEAGGHPAPGAGDIGRVPIGRLGQQGDPLPGLGLGAEMHAVGAIEQDDVEAAVGAERHAGLIERQPLQPLVQAPFQDGVGQALVGLERGQVDPVQALAGRGQQGLAVGVGLGPDRRELEARGVVRPALAVVLAGPGRLVGLDRLGQAVGRAGRGGDGGAVQGQNQGKAQKDALGHRKLPRRFTAKVRSGIAAWPN